MVRNRLIHEYFLSPFITSPFSLVENKNKCFFDGYKEIQSVPQHFGSFDSKLRYSGLIRTFKKDES